MIKADGLAAGKGVYICENEKQSKQAVNEIFNGKFGEAENVLIEEFLNGEEMSFFIISDGISYKIFGTAQMEFINGSQGLSVGISTISHPMIMVQLFKWISLSQ